MTLNKTIISGAISGAIHTPTMSDALPINAEQIAVQAIAAANAGAPSVVPEHFMVVSVLINKKLENLI